MTLFGNDNPAKRLDVRGKISKAKKGKPNYKARGVPRSEETKRKISLAKMGHTTSPETRRKIGISVGKNVGAKASNWKGGRRMEDDGYVTRRINKKNVPEHRLVMEQAINRKLVTRETIHHWDENRANNSLDNLSLLRHASAHRRLHWFALRHKIPVAFLKFNQPWLYDSIPLSN